jgi:hypothetical protein
MTAKVRATGVRHAASGQHHESQCGVVEEALIALAANPQADISLRSSRRGFLRGRQHAA